MGLSNKDIDAIPMRMGFAVSSAEYASTMETPRKPPKYIVPKADP